MAFHSNRDTERERKRAKKGTIKTIKSAALLEKNSETKIQVTETLCNMVRPVWRKLTGNQYSIRKGKVNEELFKQSI